jgi:rhamnose transport system ATP-binding protein
MPNPTEVRPVLEMQHISKRFDATQALEDVSLMLYPGEVHALLGENGAGKSTLIKIITGVHQADVGEIILEGSRVHFTDPRAAQQAGIAAIYQEPSLFPDLDIAENIFVGRQPVGLGGRLQWSQMVEEANRLLASLGVHLDPRTKARFLSVAEQQMVEIARALSTNAKILIMDEPTSSLTPAEVNELFRIVRQLRQAGTAIVFISHRLEELLDLVDRVTVLRDGRYVGTRPMAEVTIENMIEMMVGRTLATLFPKQTVTPGEVMVEVEHLTCAGVFNDVSFQVRAGEIVGVAGLVGAGRTEVAQSIFGITPATAGVIKIEGREASIRSPRDAMALGIAYVPEDRQHHGLILPMPIAQNITLPIINRFTRRGWLRRSAEEATALAFADQMEVKRAAITQQVRQLSGGNQQKVVLAKWLATNPRILILDEPTRGIDVGTKSAVHALMSELAGRGLAILMISSELPEILGMSDRVLVMREGRITGRFVRAEATQARIMHAATVGTAAGGVN